MTYTVRRKLFHALTVIFLLAIVMLGIVRNPHVIWRFWESVRDFFHSFAALFGLPVKVTSSTLPVKLTEGFPRALAQLWETTKQASAKFFDLYNFLSYLFLVLQILTYSVYGLTLFLLAVVLPFGISIYRSLKKYNNDYNVVSRPLRAFLKFKEKPFRAVKNFLKRYVRFVKQCSYYRWAALIIVLFFTNLIPLALEVIAAYFAFIIDFDFVALGIQPVKLVYDVFLGIHFLPLWAWIPVVLAVLGRWRRARGYKKLEEHEEEFRDFIKQLRVAVMVCAAMREGKTTFITAMQMSWEKIFREQAKDSMRRIEMKFPDFPFPIFERAMRSATRDHEIYDRRTARKFVENIYSLNTKFESDVAATRKLRKSLSKRYRVRFENILFGYDTKTHPTFYDGGLGKESLEALLKTYAELYHIYTSQTSLIVSNYPVRLDDDLDDVGNFPKWEDDFYRKKPDDVQKSRLSHILNQDCLRLGTQENPDGEFNNAVQFAIFGMTEIGKERGNQFDKAGTQKNDPKPNQQNDLFNINLKLFSNAATVDYFAYARFIADEQRAPNLGADARELFHIIHLKDRSPDKIIMPLFAIEEAIYFGAKKIFDRIYDEHRYAHGDQTLSIYLFRSIYKMIFDHYNRVYNTFGGYTVRIRVEAGDDESIDQAINTKLFISNKKVRSNRFSTDAYQPYYMKKAEHSKYGLNDTPTYHDVRATMQENNEQNSLLFKRINSIFLDSDDGNGG